MDVPLSLKIAAFLLWFKSLGFGLPCIAAIRNLLSGRDIPYIMGFPAYGRGPFEQRGLYTTVPLVAGFLLVCILEGVAGWLLWSGYRTGAILALVLLIPGAVYWWGFALPVPPILGVVRTILIVLSWSTLA